MSTHPNQLGIPPGPLADTDAVELARIWFSGGHQYFVLDVAKLGDDQRFGGCARSTSGSTPLVPTNTWTDDRRKTPTSKSCSALQSRCNTLPSPCEVCDHIDAPAPTRRHRRSRRQCRHLRVARRHTGHANNRAVLPGPCAASLPGPRAKGISSDATCLHEIGRASCRERVGISVFAVAYK